MLFNFQLVFKLLSYLIFFYISQHRHLFIVQIMFIRNITKTRLPRSFLHHNQPKFFLLDHQKMEIEKEKLFGDKEKTMMLKTKFFWRQMKYTIVQGMKDIWGDSKWLIALNKKKTKLQFTGLERKTRSRIIIDLIKFIPYSIILTVPFAQLALPFMLWLFPNCVPSHFLFDTADDKRIEGLEKKQQQAYDVLIEKLMGVLRSLSKRQESFTHYDDFKRDFFQVIDELEEKLHYNSFNSDELITVLQFLGVHYFTGTAIFNKFINLFTLNIPSLLNRISRYLYSKITQRKLEEYRDPWWIKGNFTIFKFNYFPFEYFKCLFLRWQINKHFRTLQDEDTAFEKFGMEDIQGYAIRDFARERGLATLSCYITLKNVVSNDWVKVTTHPKFTNNTRLWYSVMMYHFMKQASRDMN